MEVLKNAGTHKIIAIMTGPNGETPLQLIEAAGRIAHQSQDKINPESAEEFVRRLIKMGHESVLEHSSMMVQFNNCSIGMTRELDRHRLCGITEESTRYVDEKDFHMVIPPYISYPESGWIQSIWEDCEQLYRSLRLRGVPPQDARQILPLALTCQTVLTANFREWRHIFRLRTQQKAHWEIRRVMTLLLCECQEKIPVVFEDICPEFTLNEAQSWGWKVQSSTVKQDV